MTTLTPGALQTDPVSGLSYRLLLPQPLAPRRCLVLLHGVGGNEVSVAGLAEGVADDTLVVLARGPFALGPTQFAWFQVSFTADGPRIVPDLARVGGRLRAAVGTHPARDRPPRGQPGTPGQAAGFRGPRRA